MICRTNIAESRIPRIGGRRDILIFLLVLFELQLTELVGYVNPERPVGYLPQAIRGEIGTCHLRGLVNVFPKRIGGGKGNAGLFVPELFSG
jgi:hypothetical protein